MKSTLELLDPKSLKLFAASVAVLVETKLWAKILAGMMIGIFFGSLISVQGPFAEALTPYNNAIETSINWLALPGKFFLRLIQMVIVPLILASVIKGLASAQDMNQMKTLGLRFAIYVAITSVGSALIAILIGSLWKPGAGMNLGFTPNAQNGQEVSLSFQSITPDMILNILPVNPLTSIVQGQMLEVVIIAVIAGIALISISLEQSKAVLDLIDGMQSICMTVITWAMKLAPYAVFGMMTQVAASTGLKSLASMGQYVLATYSGFLAVIILYTIAVMIGTKMSPKEYLTKISTPILLAFSTSSSAATMPMTMKTAEESLEVEPSIARFLIPLGTTVNMAGSAIWQTTAVLFISQVYNIDLNMGQIAFVVATSVGSAIGSPGVPGVGMGILAVVLGKLGIPVEGISLIMGVDRLVDMGCTVVNVVGDLTACRIFGTKIS